MKFSGVHFESFVDGDGVRVVLFTSGCPHHCKGCHNPETWDCSFGDQYTIAVWKDIYEALEKPYISGLTLSGGDPFMRPEETLKMIEGLPVKDLWIYTGYEWDELMRRCSSEPAVMMLLKKAKILVDGRFVESMKDPDLAFRGSANQRIIDVQKSLTEGTVVVDRL